MGTLNNINITIVITRLLVNSVNNLPIYVSYITSPPYLELAPYDLEFDLTT